MRCLWATQVALIVFSGLLLGGGCSPALDILSPAYCRVPEKSFRNLISQPSTNSPQVSQWPGVFPDGSPRDKTHLTWPRGHVLAGTLCTSPDPLQRCSTKAGDRRDLGSLGVTRESWESSRRNGDGIRHQLSVPPLVCYCGKMTPNCYVFSSLRRVLDDLQQPFNSQTGPCQRMCSVPVQLRAGCCWMAEWPLGQKPVFTGDLILLF